jgi:hypothetical protein
MVLYLHIKTVALDYVQQFVPSMSLFIAEPSGTAI